MENENFTNEEKLNKNNHEINYNIEDNICPISPVQKYDSNKNIYNLLLENEENFQKSFFREKIKFDDRENLISQSNINHKIESDENYTSPKKSFMERYFSKMEEGSLRGSIFAISSLALGPGSLSLAAKFKEMGFFFSIFLIIFGAFATYWSLKIMIIASKKMKINEFGKCATASYGKYMGWFIDGSILLYIFGVLVSYQVVSKINFY